LQGVEELTACSDSSGQYTLQLLCWEVFCWEAEVFWKVFCYEIS